SDAQQFHLNRQQPEIARSEQRDREGVPPGDRLRPVLQVTTLALGDVDAGPIPDYSSWSWPARSSISVGTARRTRGQCSTEEKTRSPSRTDQERADRAEAAAFRPGVEHSKPSKTGRRRCCSFCFSSPQSPAAVSR